jgi:2-dehydro-3-deoxygluconokinase
MLPTGNQGKEQIATFGEFMLRLHSHDGKRFLQASAYEAYYAGAEANVSVLLARLKVPVSYITRVPDNDLVAAGIEQLRGHGVDTSHILYGGDQLALYFTEQGNGIRSTRVIYERTGTSYACLLPGMIDWRKALEGMSWFHWSGVAAAVSQGAADTCAEALAVAQEKGISISSDFNYRATLWKYGKHPREVMPALLNHSRVAVADLDSVAVYYGIETDSNAGFEERFTQCSKALQEKLPQLEVLGMSFRKTQGIQHTYSGALMYKGAYYFSARHELPFVTDQIGSGDAFTGGMLYGLMNGLNPQQIIDFATASGALKQSIVGDWAIISKAEVEQFIQNGSSGRIIR